MSDDKELRELDARFAREVLGWTDCDPTYVSHRWEFTDPPDPPVVTGVGTDPEYGRRPLPEYTRDLNAAWFGVVKLNGLDDFHLQHHVCEDTAKRRGSNSPVGWRAQFGCTIPASDTPRGFAWANHPAEAIVRACLAAVEGQRK